MPLLIGCRAGSLGAAASPLPSMQSCTWGLRQVEFPFSSGEGFVHLNI